MKPPKNFVISKKGGTITIAFAGRVVKAKINPIRNRYVVKEDGKVIDGDVGVRITATSLGRKYSTVTGHDGKFSLPIPPGTYSVTATKTGHIYADFDLAYKHSNAVIVPDGGSAGLAFREKGK